MGINEICIQLFRNFQNEFGIELVTACFGFFAFSVAGVSENELLDLLTLENKVMREVNSSRKHLLTKFPRHVWLRLRPALGGLVTSQKTVGNIVCMRWTYSCFKFVIMGELSTQKSHYHAALANYFGGLVESKTTLTQPLVLKSSDNIDDTRFNHRRAVEAGYHMLEAQFYSFAEKELCDMESVYARAKCGCGHDHLLQIRRLAKLPIFSKNERVQKYFNWMQTCGVTSLGPRLNMDKLAELTKSEESLSLDVHRLVEKYPVR